MPKANPMTLIERANHTIDIDYPGRTWEQALAESRNRAEHKLNRMRQLRLDIVNLKDELIQIEIDYNEACRAGNLFENALIELEKERR